jgi:hypothetical protein
VTLGSNLQPLRPLLLILLTPKHWQRCCRSPDAEQRPFALPETLRDLSRVFAGAGSWGP